MSPSPSRPLCVCTGHPLIYEPGQTGGVWRVRRGVVRLDSQCGPNRLPVQLALPGDLIGVEALCELPYQSRAEALTDCELEPVDLDQRDALLREVLLQQQRRSHDMATLRAGSVLQRLSHLLRLLGLPWQGAHSVAGGQADAVRQALPSLREVAALIDARTETVCRSLAQLLPPRSRKSGPVRRSAPASAMPAWTPHDLALGL